jgi:hypothetical protein
MQPERKANAKTSVLRGKYRWEGSLNQNSGGFII